ncbi:MAG: lysophospholipid acyltransferase family protein [Bdellovibrionaceae bacterium]|nr:lysophospholipid acyltransferase family protein [Bdellovibrionales bacterium]MCB9255413.1 lysophospholipid acyltransferase family protein [Pseudobdellovibrionaceae bacterium]
MLQRLAKLFLKLIGWKMVGEPPTLDKFLSIVYPHTSNWDFFIAMAVRFASGLPVNWIAKHTLFFPPLGWLLRRMGGVPVDRTHSHNTVEQVVTHFKYRKRFILALAPEGTRKYKEFWKSGFYHMAKDSGVPLTLAYIDYAKKETGFGPVFHLTGDIRKDMDHIRSYYADKHGKNPKNQGRILLREEN